MSHQKELFESVEKFIEDSRSLLAEGAVVELAGMDTQVQDLCSRIMELSGEERLQYADLLEGLLGDLKKLGNDLVVQRDALAHEIKYLSSHKKASIAYKAADVDVGLVDDTDED